MNYDFFADRADKLEILTFIFTGTDLRIFDLSSPYEELIREYRTADEIDQQFDLQNGPDQLTTFQLWSPRFKAQPIFERIALDPKRCKGKTFRYLTGGWGMIQLYFGGIKNGILSHSHIGHFGYKGALGREDLGAAKLGKVDNWDWKEIEQTSRKLKYQIHEKLSVKKIDSRGVLKGADALIQSGLTTW